MSSTTETTQTETSSTTNTERVLGLVKWFQGGFGFVTNFDTKEDVFVHQVLLLQQLTVGNCSPR